MSYFPYRNNRRPFDLRTSFYELFYFSRDLLLTLFQFALHPLYYLFLHFPKTYEKISLFLSSLRNVIPTLDELYHTGIHWFYSLLKFLLIINKLSIKILITIAYKLLSKSESIISKYPNYIK